MRWPAARESLTSAALAMFFITLAGETLSQSNPLSPGWDIDLASSKIEFGSIKYVDNQEVIETHKFETYAGSIEENGAMTITVKLDSVNTNNDLRNVRMRFLFFETFKYPDAMISAQITPDMLTGLAPGARKSLTIPFDLDIHGVSNQLLTDAEVEVESNDRITVTSVQPLIFRVDEFGLQNNLIKIAETAGGFDIVPKMTIEYRFAFQRRAGGQTSQVAQLETVQKEDVVLERPGEFTYEQCVGRFEILSETGNIYFDSGSDRLQPDSDFVLAEVVDIIQRCPSLRIQISGHTDSDGGTAYNQDLSERRALSVVSYLMRRQVDPRRLFSTGFGEMRPMAPNDNAFNKSRNRRIEFSLYR